MSLGLTKALCDAIEASRVIGVQTRAETEDSVTFRVTVDFKISRETVAVVESVAARHGHSVGAELWHRLKSRCRWATKEKPSDRVTRALSATQSPLAHTRNHGAI
jgi:hypothetical protein